MNKKLFAILLAVMLLSCIAIGAAATDANYVAYIGDQGFTTLQNAVDAYTDTSVPIRLARTTDQGFTVTKDVYLDLNGFDVTGEVTVNAGVLYGMDSQTDDYTVEDSAGYGVLTNVTGDVSGVPAEAACAEDGYLMVTDSTSLSFHRVNLQIYAMSLRADEVGVYYKSYFSGDEKVAENVKNFGIALSVQEIPNAENLNNDCGRSVFTGFAAGSNNTNTSTLLKNVMKSENTQSDNEERSKLPIYGRAYILTIDGTYVFGNHVVRSLEEQVQSAASDANWDGYTKAQKAAAVSMYRKYSEIMRQWNVSNIESALTLDKNDPLFTLKDGANLKVLAITSSFGLNTTQMLYDVILAEAEAQGITLSEVTVGRLYASGCTLATHVANATDTTRKHYQYTKVTNDQTDPYVLSGTLTPGKMQTLIAEGEATLLDGLEDEDWDIIFMQQGARQAPLLSSYTDANGQDYIDQLRQKLTEAGYDNSNARFVWNMLWGFENGSLQRPFNTVFNSNQIAMYQANVDAVMEYVVPRTDYDRIIPTGTVIQNARTSEFGDNLCKDTYHLNNIGGILAAYGLYAVITGQELTEINIDAVTVSKTNGIGGAVKITEALTETQKAIVIESVNNALKNPFGVTQSAYPTVDYSAYTYTEKLSFFGDSTIAVCPACDDKVTWIEVNQNNLSSMLADGNGNGYFGDKLSSGHHHFYLSESITYTAADDKTAYSFIYAYNSGRNVCLHLNGHDLTATNCAVVISATSNVINIMGTGTVCGNASAHQTDRGATLQINSGTTGGTLNLYSGTFIKPANDKKSATISMWIQGGNLNVYEDATVIGNGDHAIFVSTQNTKTLKAVNLYNATVSNGDIYFDGVASTVGPVTFKMDGGSASGITILGNTNATLTGAPMISGTGLKLAEGITVTLSELAENTSIAVDATGPFTVVNTLAADYLKYFSAVRDGYRITEENGVLSCTQS